MAIYHNGRNSVAGFIAPGIHDEMATLARAGRARVKKGWFQNHPFRF